jgi:Glycosyl transferase family 90
MKFMKERTLLRDLDKNYRRIQGVQPVTTRKQHRATIFTDVEEKRIAYYLGDVATQVVPMLKDTKAIKRDGDPKQILAMNYKGFINAVYKDRRFRGYCYPIIRSLNILGAKYKRKYILLVSGDNRRIFVRNGLLAKTRVIGDAAISLLKLKPQRHWQYLLDVASIDMAYKQKKSMAVWRGGTTGGISKVVQRRDLVSRYYDNEKFDIGFSAVTQKNNVEERYIKELLSRDEQLAYKCLVSVEGNDVSTALKWMLVSRSTVLMPVPSVESWLMEGLLVPFEHYVPLENDFSDLEEKFDWAMSNEAECMAISQNAREYMRPFLDLEREILIECEVLKRYLDNVELI